MQLIGTVFFYEALAWVFTVDTRLLVDLAESAALYGRWNDANDLFEEACSETASSEVRIAYGICLAGQEKFHEAICQFCHVLDSTDLRAKAIVMHNLACIYRELDEPELARRFQQLAISFAGGCGSEELLGVANDAYLTGNDGLASSLMVMIDAKLSSAEESDLDHLATRAVIDRADARESLFRLFAVYRQRPRHDVRRRGIDLMNLAMLFAILGRVNSQKRCLERAISRFTVCTGGYSLRRIRECLRNLRENG